MDERLTRDSDGLEFGLDFVRKLKPCLYKYNAPFDDGRLHAGFIAQEIADIVGAEKYGFVGIDTDGTYRIGYGDYIAPIVKAIQELTVRIEALESK